MIPYPRQAFMFTERNVINKTVVDLQYQCREICIAWADNVSITIGGSGKTVEIDESMFDHRKYYSGKLVKGRWVFGGIERESKKIFLVAVENRTAETLCAVIKQWILPGLTIVSDCWRSYSELSSLGFEHLRVNHRCNFVDLETCKEKALRAHTQNIERTWREQSLPAFGRRDYHYAGYFAEFMFKRYYAFEKIIPAFVEAIANYQNNV